MNERRRALVARFRASAVDRLRKLTLALVAMETGDGTTETLSGVLRELHTLKGESRMLDLVPLAETVHAVEDRLLAASHEGELATRVAATAVIGALDVARAWLGEELGEDADALAALWAAKAALSTPVVDARPMSHAPTSSAVARSGSPTPPQTDARPSVAARANRSNRWVSVAAEKVDGLCELLSEFETEFRSLQFRVREYARTTSLGSASTHEPRALVSAFDDCRLQLESITASAWGLRLVPVEPLLAELLGGHARTLATAQKKRLRVSVDGGHVLVERMILDALAEPLLHLVRNSVDHGVEPPEERRNKGDATLKIRAESIGRSVVVTIADDGQGIDRERVRRVAVARGFTTDVEARAMPDDDVLGLLFLHGFSTRDEVTELSGRGVGLDIVRTAVEAIGGIVRVASEPGVATSFTLTVPASISKEKNLVIDAGGGLYAIPSRHVAGLLRLSDVEVKVPGTDAVWFDGQEVPLFSLSSTLRSGADESRGGDLAVVVDGGDGVRSAFSVTTLLGEFALLRRPIDRVVGASTLVGASSTFEDGRLILILSVPAVIRHRRAGARYERTEGPRIAKVLAIDDSAIVRALLEEVLAHAGFDGRVAADGEAGLAMLAREAVDAVILDVDMPRLSGFEVLERLRAKLPDVPVVMLTTRSSPEDRAKADAMGASAYIVKAEFQETILVRTLARLVGRGRSAA